MDRRTRVRVHVIRVTRRVRHSIAQRRMGFELLMTEQSSVQQLLATCQVEYLPGNGVRMHTHTTAAGGIHAFRGREPSLPEQGAERRLGKSERDADENSTKSSAARLWFITYKS